MAKVRARKRRSEKRRCFGSFLGYGPSVTDQVSGMPIPKSLAVKQRGGYVYRERSYGTRDDEQSRNS